MNTILLTWNPKHFHWKNLSKQAARVRAGVKMRDQWNCYTKHVPIGTRFFLLMQAKEKKGIVASGHSTTHTKIGPHWIPKKAALGITRRYIGLEFDALLDPECDSILPLEAVEAIDPQSEMYWHPRISGVAITPSIAPLLEALWRSHGALSPVVDQSEEYFASEGEPQKRMVLHRRREAKLRKAKIQAVLKAEGCLRCEVPGCDFDFHEVYGKLGREFAHVHHKRALTTTGPVITKLSDLAIICANCHAMIHRGGECRRIESVMPRKRKRANRQPQTT